MAIKIKPVWGDISPEAVIGYKIVVCPKNHHESCWEFLVLIPAGDTEPEDLTLVSEMCEAAIRVGDTFCMYRLCQEDEEEYKSLPVMWFRPGEDEPSWLTPPLEMMM